MNTFEYCRIKNYTFYHNDTMVFKAKEQELDDFLDESYSYFAINYPKFYKLDVLSKMGILASSLLFKNYSIPSNPFELGILFSNSQSSIESDIRYAKTIETIPSPSLFVYTLPNIVMGEISIKFGIQGEQAFFIDKNFDPAFLNLYAARVMEAGETKCCLCGWIDVTYELHDVFLYLLPQKSLEENQESFIHKILEIYNSHGTVDSKS